MNALLTGLILIAIFFFTTEALDCNSGNPCQIGGYFSVANGYQCRQQGASAVCLCPGGESEIDVPCRLCNRDDSRRNPCNEAKPNFIACLETKDYGTSYVCLFADLAGNPVATTNYEGDLTVTLTSTSTTTVASIVVPICNNGGVLSGSTCHCPSGFNGQFCQTKHDEQLCNGIVCKNGGYCIIRNPTGPYESQCACKATFFGDYCEIQGTAGFCSSGSCSNGGACKEFVTGTVRYAYCQCTAGYNGVKCDNRYFNCPSAGNWTDIEMFSQGKYFACTTLLTGGFRVQQKSCPKGLRFNMIANRCTT